MTIDLLFVNYHDNQVNQQQLFLIYYIMLLFNPNSNIAILANKSSTARDILSRVQLAMKIYQNGYNKVL